MGATTRMRGSARTPSVVGLNTVVRFGRGAASFLAFPISLDKVGIKKAAVLPDPAVLMRYVSYTYYTMHLPDVTDRSERQR